MLVLTRKIGESVVIGNDVRVTVVQLGPGRVKIGIDAPRWMAIDREEVHVRKEAEADAEADQSVTVLPNRIAEIVTPSEALPRKSR